MELHGIIIIFIYFLLLFFLLKLDIIKYYKLYSKINISFKTFLIHKHEASSYSGTQ